MKSLASAKMKAELLERLENLSPDSQGRWGRMTVNQMLCHVYDASFLMRQDLRIEQVSLFKQLRQRFMTWLVLDSGLPTPRGVPTMHQLDQEKGGTTPESFDHDKSKLIEEIEIFATKNDFENCYHPMFGYLSIEDWQRWAYYHADYHLNQFGV